MTGLGGRTGEGGGVVYFWLTDEKTAAELGGSNTIEYLQQHHIFAVKFTDAALLQWETFVLHARVPGGRTDGWTAALYGRKGARWLDGFPPRWLLKHHTCLTLPTETKSASGFFFLQ